ncbi:uncharacterized protein K02A2.6-like [Malaya genurostris]|uniref:uncharacterized protein K02A2.6-like n=1 Tax=Malaya genurostris TaxID=325434 RepID=UPI0026F3CD4D|nr:uncharacterized protein K02A2.6-like [Malaya genurostris]
MGVSLAIIQIQSKIPQRTTNIADPFSRLAAATDTADFERESEFLILAVLESAAIDVSEIESESAEDLELAAVRACLLSGKWDKTETKPYDVFREELGMIGNTLIRGNKMIVPVKLRPRMLKLAHEGHPGESVMKRRLRDRVWWPNMDRQVVDFVSACEGCRLVGLPSHPEPMQRRPLPCKPWIDVALDFLGPLPTGDYLLVLIDYYSRYKEIEIMPRITARDTIHRLGRIFTRLGYPVTITLDNARQFISAEFEEYCSSHGIHLNNTTPYWPQENGLVERQNRSILKRLQISQALKRDWKTDLNDYLVMYYTTPHSVTGKTPTEMFYGHTIRSKLPRLSDIEEVPRNDEVFDCDFICKQKGKEHADKKRQATPSLLRVRDTVLMQNLLPGNKLTTTYGPTEFEVVDKTGARVVIQNKQTNKVYERNSAHLKRVSPTEPEGNPEIGKEQVKAATNVIDKSQNEVSTRLHRTVRRPQRFEDFVLDTETSSLGRKGRCDSGVQAPLADERENTDVESLGVLHREQTTYPSVGEEE